MGMEPSFKIKPISKKALHLKMFSYSFEWVHNLYPKLLISITACEYLCKIAQPFVNQVTVKQLYIFVKMEKHAVMNFHHSENYNCSFWHTQTKYY